MSTFAELAAKISAEQTEEDPNEQDLDGADDDSEGVIDDSDSDSDAGDDGNGGNDPAESDDEYDGEADHDSDEGEEEEEPAKAGTGLAIDPKAKYQIGDKEVTGQELLDGRMLREDYTRKTQAISEERKQLQGSLTEISDKFEDAVEWARSLHDVDTMELELIATYPKTYQALVDRILQHAVEESEIAEKDPRMLEHFRQARQARLERIARKRDEDYDKRVGNRVKAREKTAEMAKSFNTWAIEAMTGVGLDPNNPDHKEAVIDRLISGYKGQQWTAETFVQAAKRIAAILKVEPPQKKESKEEKAKKLPSIRGTGNKVKSEKEAPKKKIQQDDNLSGMDRLRKQYGL